MSVSRGAASGDRCVLALAVMALLDVGCGRSNRSDALSDAALRYHNAQYDLTFSLPASWQGYSVAVREWVGQTYLSATDQVAVTDYGPLVVLRHPQWKADDLYQDIPILVFTRRQWDDHHQGRFIIGVGGVEVELGHNPAHVFAISSRFNAADSVKGWKEATEAVGRNMAANGPPLRAQ